MKPPLIALTGYGRAGKDVLGAELVKAGFHRAAFGDIVKGIFNAQCLELLGYSAFTEENAQKEHLRPLLVHGGQVFYGYVSEQYFSHVDMMRSHGQPVVNTRLFRIEEARLWKERGGYIWEVERKGNPPKEPEEARSLEELRAAGLIDCTFKNHGTLADWEFQSREIARIWRPA